MHKVVLLAFLLLCAHRESSLAQTLAPIDVAEAAPTTAGPPSVAPPATLLALSAPIPTEAELAAVTPLAPATAGQAARQSGGTSAITWVSVISGLLVSVLLVVQAASK